ncbi:MAG TPA: hypothetical protein VFP10_14080 [Candidatus Eisenbacteria bacterium]|nr:hypothetical protein [Candidatus Eisenbacteria bacterium]
MNQFRVSDLMINMGPQQYGGGCWPYSCGFPSIDCLGISPHPCTWNTAGCYRQCSYFITCAWNGITFDPCHYGGITINPCHGGITPIGCAHFISDPCGFHSPVIRDPGQLIQPPDFARLKEQLQTALKQVEAQEKVAAEGMRPQTLEQVNELEQKLTKALEELRARKTELQSQQGQKGR